MKVVSKLALDRRVGFQSCEESINWNFFYSFSSWSNTPKESPTPPHRTCRNLTSTQKMKATLPATHHHSISSPKRFCRHLEINYWIRIMVSKCLSLHPHLHPSPITSAIFQNPSPSHFLTTSLSSTSTKLTEPRCEMFHFHPHGVNPIHA